MVELHSSISENVKGKFEQQRQNKKRGFISEQQGLILTDGQLTFMTLFHPSYGTFNVIHYFCDIQALVDSIRRSVTKIVTIPSQREPFTRLNPF